MHPNEEILKRFYQAFQNKDFSIMQHSYHDEAVFYDPAFENLNAAEVRAMWEMLCKRGKDLTLEYRILHADDKSGSAEWIATYTFSATGRKVINRIHADFTFRDDKIILHKDTFDFYRWIKQAFGITGVILGWTGWMQNKIRSTAKKNLQRFMEKSNSDS